MTLIAAQADQTFSKRPRIIRTPHNADRPYFSMSRAAAQDRQLSWEARGVLAYLLSKPDDWELMIADLRQNCGRTKVYHILDELMEHGYLDRTAERDKKGVIKNWCYTIHEVPLSKNLKVDNAPLSNNGEVDSSHLPESPLSGLQEVDNADAYIIQNQQSTEKTSLQPAAGASVAGAPEVAAKAVVPETKQESTEPVKGEPLTNRKNLPPGAVLAAAAKKPKAPQPADVLFNAIGEHVFKATDKASVAAVASRIALIMNGDVKHGRCIGIIGYECLRQNRERNELDYNQLAQDVGLWKRWHDTHKTFTVKDCVTVLDSWQEWRGNGGTSSETVIVEVESDSGAWVEKEVRKADLEGMNWRKPEWTTK